MGQWGVDVSGPARVFDRSESIELRTKERATIAALALHHPAPATAASLAPLIWGNDLPATATKSVHNHIARIRTRAPGLIETTSSGYGFTEDTTVDSDGGTASYLELADQPAVAVARARDRVEALRRAEERLRPQVRSGASEALLAETRAMLDAAPQRLVRWWWVALTLARLGRRRQALDSLRSCRRDAPHLDEAALTAIDHFERAIADDDIFLDTPAAADPRTLGADRTRRPDPSSTVAPVGIIDATGFIGRTIRTLDEGATSSTVVGPTGGGKSSAIQAIAQQLPPLGWHCFVATCSPVESDPLAPLVALDAQRRERSGDAEVRREGEAAGDYATGLIDSITKPSNRRVLLVVDDVHYADAETETYLAELVGRIDARAGDVAVLLATRPGGPSSIETAVRLELPDWDRPAVESYVHSFVPPGRWADGAIDWIDARADGNPLFVRELTISALRRLPDDPVAAHFVQPEVASLVSDRSELRVDALPERLRSLLTNAAALGDEFRRTDLAALTDNVPPLLALARAHGLIEPIDAERHRFTHQRFRQLFLDQLDDDARVAVARRIAAAISGAADADQRLADLARFARDASSQDPERAIETTLAQARQALDELRTSEALSLARLALRLVHDVEGKSERWANTSVLAGVAGIDTGAPDAAELLIAGGLRAIELDAHDTVAAAATRLAELSPTTGVGEVHRETALLLAHCDDHVTDPVVRAVVSRGAAFAATLADDPDEARRRYFEADELSRHADDPLVRAEVLASAYTPLSRPDDVDHRREITAELHALAHRLGRIDLEYAAYRFDFSTAIAAGGADPREPMEHIERIAARLGQRSRNWSLFAFRATIALLDGNLDEAEFHTNRLLSDDVTVSPQLATSTYGAHLFAIRLLQDRLHELDPLVVSLQHDQSGLAIWSAVRVATATEDDPAAARAAFDTVFDAERHRIPESFTMLAGLLIAAEGAIRLGDTSRMRTMLHHLDPYAGRWAWFNVGVVGPIDLTLARLHAALGNAAAARATARRGLESTERVGAPVFAGLLAPLLATDHAVDAR